MGYRLVFFSAAKFRELALEGRAGFELWEAAAVKAENASGCMSHSFLLAISIRFGLSGQLPNLEGYEQPLRYGKQAGLVLWPTASTPV